MTRTPLMTFIIIWLSTVSGENHWHLAIVLSIIHTFTLLITPLVSSNIWPLHLCVRRFTDSDYPFGIFKCVAIALSVLWFTDSDYSYGIFKCVAIALSVLWFTDSDDPFDIFKHLAIIFVCYSNYEFWLFLWYFSNFWKFCCLFFICGFRLLLWYLQTLLTFTVLFIVF